MEYCIVCKTKLRKFGKNSSKTILSCPTCGLGVTKEGTKLDYSNYHRDKVYEQNEEQFKNIFSSFVKKIPNYKKSGRVLDIGSSTGLLLQLFLKQGWEVQGIEPSKSAREYATARGIPTINSTFEDENLNLEKFDVVVMDHVLEHMSDPNKVLEKVNKLLNKEGTVMVNVPNFASLSAKLYGAGWEYVLPQEHLWHFTPKSLQLLLEKHGFLLISWEARSGIWDYDNPALELWQSFIGMKKRFFKNFLTAFPTWFISQAKLGTGLSIIAKKNV